MVKYLLVLFILLKFSLCNVCGQIKIINLKSQKEIDSIRNHSHFLIKRLSDSVWFANEYDLNDTLLTSGTYKDEKLQIPDGKFKIYNFNEPVKHVTYDYVNHKSDTVLIPGKNYLNTVGYFANAKRTGIWYIYNDSGKLIMDETFDNDKLNGVYRTYSAVGTVYIQGNYINDVRQGDWNMLTPSGDVIRTDVYKNGKIVKSISHISEKKAEQKFTGGKPKYDFVAYLNKHLAEQKFDNSGVRRVLYSFIIDTLGKLTKPSVLNGSETAIDRAIIDVMLSAPNWEPTYINNKLTTLSVPFNFEIIISDDKHIHISYKEF